MARVAALSGLLLLVVCAALVYRCATEDPGPDERTESRSGAQRPGADSSASAVPTSEVAPKPAKHAAIDVADSDHTPAEDGDGIRAASLELAVTWAADGSPAACIGVAVHPRGGDSETVQRGCTSDVGVCVFENVPAGSAHVIFWTEDTTTVTLHEGEHTRVEVALRVPGLTVDGIVVDRAGVGVADARIWVSEWLGSDPEGAELTRTAADGTFRLRGVAPNRFIGAAADGLAPSLLQAIHPVAQGGSAPPIRLVLPGEDAWIEGTVLDPEGAAVAGARLRAVHEKTHAALLEDGSMGFPPPAQHGQSDAKGQFRIQGIAPGLIRLDVSQPGFAPCRMPVDLSEGHADPLVVTLTRGATIRGAIREPDGSPCATAKVTARTPDGLRFATVESGPDGSFEIAHAPAGTYELRAESGSRSATGSVEALDGIVCEWNATLAEGFEFRGRLVGAAGEGLVAWMVIAQPMDPRSLGRGWSGHTPTGTGHDGGFAFSDCPRVPLSLHFRGSGPEEEFWVDGVTPTSETVVFRWDGPPLPAKLQGTVVGSIPEGAALEVCRRWNTRVRITHDIDPRGGPFEIEVPHPGAYSIRVSAGNATRELGEVALEPGETRDLGEIALGGIGRVKITVRGEKLPTSWFSLVAPAAEVGEHFRIDGNEGTSGPMHAGPYWLRFNPDAFAWNVIEVEIKEGETTAVVIDLEPAVKVRLRFQGLAAFERVHFDLVRRADAIARPNGGGGGAIVWTGSCAGEARVNLAPGDYELRARAGDRTAQTAIFIGAENVGSGQIVNCDLQL